MTGAIDFTIEHGRHRGFVGREALLAELDRLLVQEPGDRWVVVTGGPGMGKSALLSKWLARRREAGDAVPHHFIRRQHDNWDDPVSIVASLVAQIDARLDGQREPEADANRAPVARLAATLGRASRALAPHGARLVVLLDGLDEYDTPKGTRPEDPLLAFLPPAAPPGISFLCASRPRHPYINAIARRGVPVRIDLDDANAAADNDAIVRAVWTRDAPKLGLDKLFIDEAVRRAQGNVLHADMLCNHLAGLTPTQRRVLDVPWGVEELVARTWDRIADDPVVVNGLGVLCAAGEALSLEEIAIVAGWNEAERRAFLRGAREVLVESQRTEQERAYRLHHDSIRAYVATAIGAKALRSHHRALARKLATWPLPLAPAARRYALRHALTHRAEAGDWQDAWRIASDMAYIETNCRELGAVEAEAEVARAAERCPADPASAWRRRFTDLSRALGLETRWLAGLPESTAGVVWNRLRRIGWSRGDIDRHLRISPAATFLRLRHIAEGESVSRERILIGHADRVRACAMTPDGRRVVSASNDRTLKVWDLATGAEVATLQGHADWVRACAVTPEGRRVVSASDDRTLKVWDLATGAELATLQGHADCVAACAATSDGRRIVSASADRTLKIWDLATGAEVATLHGHAAEVLACAVTPDGRHVVSASEDRTLKVWDLATGVAVVTLQGHTNGVRTCAVTSDGRRVVSGSDDQTLKVWNLATGAEVATMQGHTASVSACAVTPDGRRAVSASDDRTLKVWDLATGAEVDTLQGHDDWVSACAVTPDGHRAVSASADWKLTVWSLATGTEGARLQGHSALVSACAATPDGRRIVSVSADQTLKVWDPTTGVALATLHGHAALVSACAVTPDGRRVVSASVDRTLKVWDVETGAELATLHGHADWVRACAVTPDELRVVSASADRTLKVWDLATGTELATLRGHSASVSACAVTPDGRRAVSASDDRTLKVWDLATGAEVATLQGHNDWVSACAVTPDGRRAVSASASYDLTLRVWDMTTGAELTVLRGHADWVSACAVTPDGRRVVSTSDDRTLKVWDLDTGACLLTHHASVELSAVAVSETTIVVGDAAGSVWFLDMPPDPRTAATTSERDVVNDSLPPDPRPTLPRSGMQKHTILFLAANPSGTSQRALDQEARAIRVELERAGDRDRFELVTRWAAEPLDLLRELRKLKPTVVHFSGHGDADELIFQGVDGRPQPVSAAAVAQAFGAAGSSVQIVVLSARYSESQAAALLAHVDCVVGMRDAIGDDAARSFAIGFYGGLGERESVAKAFDQGCAAVGLEGHPDRDRPQLMVRTGVDAGRLVLGLSPGASGTSQHVVGPPE